MLDLQLDNNTALDEIFVERFLYEFFAYNNPQSLDYRNPPGIKDYWKFENILYGKVSPSLVIIQPDKSKLVSIPNQEETFYTFREVSRNFTSFQNSFKIPSQSGRLAEDNYLNSPVIFRSFIDADNEYNENMTKMLRNHNAMLLSGEGSDQIINIKDYAKVFFDQMLNKQQATILTKSSYVLSNKVSALNSALSIEIADLNPSNNLEKKDFIDSPNFNFYRQTAINNGFLIDKNIPWRLNYDLSSPVATTSISFISENFSKVRFFDLDRLISIVVVGYNSLVKQKIQVKQGICSYTRLPIEKNKVIASVLPMSYWLKRYCQVRNMESGNIYSKNELDKIIRNAIDLNDLNLSYVSSKFRLPYLFEGSTVYQELKKYYLEKNNISLDNFSEHVTMIIKNSINKIY